MELLKPEVERHGFSALERQMNRLFGDFFGERVFKNGDSWLPALDVAETPETVVVTAEVPGVDPKEIEITVKDNRLEIRGEKREEKETKGKEWHVVERRAGTFHRSIFLPAEVEAERVEAVTKNGLVTITLPKRKEAKGKQIPVKTS